MAIFIYGAVILLIINILLCVFIEEDGIWIVMFPTVVGLALMFGAYFSRPNVTVEEQISKNNKKIERLIQENNKLESLKGDK